MAYNYTQPYYNPCYPANYNYGNHYQQPSYPYVQQQQQYAGGYPQNYPAISYPGYAPKYPTTNNAFTIVKTDNGDAVYALNSYDTLTIASSDTDNLIITGDKCNKKITFDLSGVVTSDVAMTRNKGTLRTGGIGTITQATAPTISAAAMVNNTVLVYAVGVTAAAAIWDSGTNIDAQLAALDGVNLAGAADATLSFDVTIVNNSAAVFTFGALNAQLTSGSGLGSASGSTIATAAAFGGNSATFRFVRTGTGLFTIYRIV
jgi:hypothetical protein